MKRLTTLLVTAIAATLMAVGGCRKDSSYDQPLSVSANIQTSGPNEALATISPPQEIILTFSEPLNRESVGGNVSLQVVKTGSMVVAVEPAVEVLPDGQDPRRLIIKTMDGSQLPSGEEYQLAVVRGGIRSTSGNTLLEDYIRYFATDYDFAVQPGLPPRNTVRTRTIIISDLHLGDQRSIDHQYGWFIQNREKLVDFLGFVRQQPDVKELVIAGDLFDEWVAPMEYDPLNGATQSGFVDMIVTANRLIIDAFNAIIQDNAIRVTYVPGNHDMLVVSADIQRVFPGINEARDAPGLGVYTPADPPALAIEHGHRYDFFNAPDPISNRDITKTASILSPGFFVSKIAASSDLGKRPPSYYRDGLNAGTTATDYFSYWAAWELIMSQKPVDTSWDAKVIETGIDGYSDRYAINDLIPQHSSNGAPLDVVLYKNIEDTWGDRQTSNNMLVKIPITEALAAGAVNQVLDLQAGVQYFLNSASDRRIVIFGHTHHADLVTMLNHTQQWSIYANSGAWVDSSKTPCTFVTIDPQKANGATTDTVTVFQFINNNTIAKIKSAAIRR